MQYNTFHCRDAYLLLCTLQILALLMFTQHSFHMIGTKHYGKYGYQERIQLMCITFWEI